MLHITRAKNEFYLYFSPRFRALHQAKRISSRWLNTSSKRLISLCWNCESNFAALPWRLFYDLFWPAWAHPGGGVSQKTHIVHAPSIQHGAAFACECAHYHHERWLLFWEATTRAQHAAINSIMRISWQVHNLSRCRRAAAYDVSQRACLTWTAFDVAQRENVQRAATRTPPLV